MIAMSLFVVPAQAKTAVSEGATLGDCDTKNFNIKIRDDQNYIDEFSLTTLTPTTPLSAKSLFQDSGVPLVFSFSSTNILTNEQFKFSSETGEKYGNEYKVDASKRIRILPDSYLRTSTSSDYAFGKEFYLTFRFDGNSNYISMSKTKTLSNPIDVDDCEDLDTNLRDILQNLEGKIAFEISLLTTPGQTWGETKPLTKTFGVVVFDKDGIRFTPFSENKANANLEGTEDTASPKTRYGLGGYGFLLPGKDQYQGISNETDLKTTIVGLTNWVLMFVASIAVIILIYGGYLWIVDQGDDQMTEKAKQVITNAVIGILLIISAYTIVNTMINFSDAYPAGCEVSVGTSGGGVNAGLDCGSDAKNAMIGAGVKSLYDLIF